MQSGILFLVSIERGTSRRVYHRRPWLSDMSQLGGALCRFLVRPWLWRASVSSDRRAQKDPQLEVAGAGTLPPEDVHQLGSNPVVTVFAAIVVENNEQMMIVSSTGSIE